MKIINNITRNIPQIQITKRIEWLDAVKGTGILLVLLNHIELLPQYSIFLTAGYMALFYIAAGYTIKKDKYGNDVIIKKFKRLIYPYFFYGVISIIVSLILSFAANSEYPIQRAFLGLIYSRYSLCGEAEDNWYFLRYIANSPLWFLTSLFTSYLVFYYYKRSRLTGGYCMFLFCAISMLLDTCPILLPWSIDTAFVCALLIIYGQKRITTCYSKKTFLLTSLLYILIVCFEKHTNISIREYGTHGVLSVITYLMVGICEYNVLVYILTMIENTILSKILSSIGRISLLLLATHAIIFRVLRALRGARRHGAGCKRPLHPRY